MKQATLTYDPLMEFYYDNDVTVSICREEVMKMLGLSQTAAQPKQIVLTLNPEGAHRFKPDGFSGILDGRHVDIHWRLQQFLSSHNLGEITFDIYPIYSPVA